MSEEMQVQVAKMAGAVMLAELIIPALKKIAPEQSDEIERIVAMAIGQLLITEEKKR